jgi:hypothetical protein
MLGVDVVNQIQASKRLSMHGTEPLQKRKNSSNKVSTFPLVEAFVNLQPKTVETGQKLQSTRMTSVYTTV